mgnify:CR=1 FL=1
MNVNRAVAASARELLEHAQVIHLTGKGKDDEVRSLVSVSAGEQVLGELGPDHGNDAIIVLRRIWNVLISHSLAPT